MSEWKSILNKLASKGIMGNKDWKYLRDITWQNIKRGTMIKLDNAKKTGSSGGSKCILSDLDNIIIDIIGKESPTVQGIEEGSISIPDSVCSVSKPQNVEVERNTSRAPSSQKESKKRKQENLQYEMLILKKKRIELEIYNLQLDARKKEQDLGIQSNTLTSTLVPCEGEHYRSSEEEESEREEELEFSNY